MENIIKKERKKLKLSQTALAEKLNVSRQTIYSLETKKFSPSAVLAMKLSKIFSLKTEDLFQLETSDYS